MPYEMNDEQLRTLVTRAYNSLPLTARQNKSVQERYTPKDFYTKVTSQFMKEVDRAAVWRPANKAISKIQALEAERETHEKTIEEGPRLTEPVWLSRLLVVPGLMMLAVVLTVLGAGLLYGWDFTFNVMLDYSRNPFPVLGVLFSPILAYIVARLLLNLQHDAKHKEHEKLSAELRQRVSELTDQINARVREADEAVIRTGIQTALREIITGIITGKLAESYALTLERLPHEGLVEVRNAEYDIPTDSYEQLNQLVKTARGGSIGLAGPRGSGKTTLMNAICNTPKLEKQNSKVIPVMTSAPVVYDSRDFIILMFKLVCNKYLQHLSAERWTQENQRRERNWRKQYNPVREMDQELKLSRSNVLPVLFEVFQLFGRTTLLVLTALGILLLSISLFLAASTPAQSPAASVTETALPATPAGGTLVTQMPVTVVPATTFRSTTTRSSGVVATLEKVGITPASLFRWGWILILTSLAMRTGQRYFVNRVIVDESLRSGKLRAEVLEWAWEARLLSWRIRKFLEERGDLEFLERIVLDIGPRDLAPDLEEEAKTWLRNLHFQQSYSSGWSGSLKLPVGVETGLQNSMQLAQYQLSVPEIVTEYQEFVKKLIADEYTVIIGIDELDKMGSAEDAYKFLNAIKSLFGIDNCFYLISVSENAMSSFERRGLPVRDEFDSSFDKIIYVDYMDYRVSQRLLNRRVIGIPVPFIAFCYCLSGGLPRDLIRCCRLMFELLENEPQSNSLKQLVQAMIRDDLERKLQAVVIAAKQSQAFEDVNKLLEGIYRLESLLPGASTLPFHSSRYFRDYVQKGAPGRKSKKVDEEKRKLAVLITELDAYLYYIATLHAYFTNLDIKRFRQDEERFELDRLARARQLFAYSVAESQRIIKEFRESHHMDRPSPRTPRRRTSQKPAKKAKPATPKKSAA
jgi:Cdc6-like AAA superfamily ATPase